MHHTQTRTAALAATALIALTSLSACSSNGDAAAAKTQSNSPTAPASPTQAEVVSDSATPAPTGAATTSATPVPSEQPSQRPRAAGTLTHTGYGPIRLGMSVAALKRTGAVTLHVINHKRSGCAATFKVKSDPGVTGYVSWDHGVVAIFAGKRTRTVDGIHNGSSAAAAHKAYPRATSSANGWFVRLSPKGARPEIDYRFAFSNEGNGPVTDLFLQRGDQDCYE